MRSVTLLGIVEAGKAGHGVELPQQLPQQLVGIVLGAQLLELAEDARQCLVGIGNGSLREILTLSSEAFAVPGEFFAVEVFGKTYRDAENPTPADDACHATPRVGW
jgi:hypothetical protein